MSFPPDHVIDHEFQNMKVVTKSGHGTLFAGKMKEHTHYEQTEREELLEDIASGSLSDKDVTFYNVGECELSWDTDYYELGKQVKSWTEINGMVSEHAAIFDPNKPVPERPYNAAARFIPKLDNVKIISYPWIWLLDQITTHAGVLRYPSPGIKQNLSVFQDIKENERPFGDDGFGRHVKLPSRLFTSMMRRPKPHRTMMWDLLNNAGLIGSEPYGPDSVCTNVAVEGYQIDLPHGEIVWTKDQHTFPKWYFDCAIDVVTESVTDNLFYTEKTWKPLLGMRIPLYLSGKAHYTKLTEMGFMFPDWLQWDTFDHMETDYLRCKRIVEILLELKDQDWQSLFNQCWGTRVHNQANCLNLIIDGSIPQIPEEVASDDYVAIYEVAKETAQKCWRHLKSNDNYSQTALKVQKKLSD